MITRAGQKIRSYRPHSGLNQNGQEQVRLGSSFRRKNGASGFFYVVKLIDDPQKSLKLNCIKAINNIILHFCVSLTKNGPGL